ncbi:MAG: peptidylprolyl isomerase [Balneolaceae bacterium]
MCNKQTSCLKLNAQLKLITGSVSLLVLLMFFTGCENEPIHTFELNMNEAQVYQQAMESRSVENLLSLPDFENEYLNELVWSAIAKSDVEDINQLINRVKEVNSYSAWWALSFHDLSSDEIASIQNGWVDEEFHPAGVCEVLGRLGDELAVDLLLQQPDFIVDHESCALAIGRIATRVEFSEEQILIVFDLAFDAPSKKHRRNLLYGFYRNRVNDIQGNEEWVSNLIGKWEAFGLNENPELDQMLVQITGEQGWNLVMENRTGSDLNQQVQLSVELARVLGEIELPEDESIKRLLSHQNPHAAIATLESLEQLDEVSNELLDWIEINITRPSRNHELFIQSLSLLSENERDILAYQHKIEFSESKNPYLMPSILPVYQHFLSDEEYTNKLMELTESGGVAGLSALNELENLWIEGNLNGHQTEQVKQLVYDIIDRGDRILITGTEVFLMDSELFSDEEFLTIIENSNKLDVQQHREIFAVLATVYFDRFEAESNEWINKLVDAGSVRLNHHLNELELDVAQDNRFRSPDWNRLQELGSRPHWILETEKGKIEIELEPLRAPFTVSSIDSLTTSGFYDGVPFHRVVPNFVVQGGDFTLQNGVGSPDYFLPTESSQLSFERGALGIASSGTDTEGSQYFLMNQRAPHLDGHYTRFGNVVYGMNVVDRLQVGDNVIKATISAR